MFDQAINYLRTMDLISKEDIIVACMDNVPNASSSETLSNDPSRSAASGRYILVANRDGLRIFDVDRRTGAFLGTYSRIVREEITGATVKKGTDTFSVKVRTRGWGHTYMTENKFHGRHQKEDIVRLKEFFESDYGYV